jgi:predicted ATPase/class 3 adenylate cyclase
MDIVVWLRSLGLGRYEAAFRENDIDETVLPSLTDEHLKQLGVMSLGHRVKLLNAIAALRSDESGKLPSVDAGTTSDTPSARPDDRAERRQVTVMFSDLVGSTALSARMDPEDLRKVISAYQKCVAETVQHLGGFVAKYMGDGVLIYFGYPQAHEDDAERAVRAGLELVAAVGALKIDEPLQTRVGIATGLVVVGDLIGSGASQEQAIVGETPNLAARLQGVAQPNNVIIAESTRRLVGPMFELVDLEPQHLKGIAGPIQAWAALQPSSIESRFDALHAGGLTELIGRDEELELLLRRWSKARNGEGQVVCISGEAGIGKSRLTAALLESVAQEPHTRLRYFCSPQHTDSALHPIISHLERAAQFAPNDGAQVKLDKLDTVLKRSSTPKQDGALLADMLSLPNDGRHPILDLSAQQRRENTLDALVAQLETLSRSNPVLMIFEDAHWIDPTSLEALGRTIDRLRALRLLLIITHRPEFEPPWLGRSNVAPVNLNRLGDREIVALIDRITGNQLLADSVRQDIIERTDGIPLFVEEMTKAVLEAGSDGEAKHIVATVPASAFAVPPSLHASLLARLDRLGPAKDIAQIGSVIGREFSHALLAALVSLSEIELNSAIDKLVRAGLLFRQGRPPYAAYLFKHALVQDAAYGTLLRERRRALHARIAETIEHDFADITESQPELVARHCTEAGLVEKAATFWGRAGLRSLERSALIEGMAHLTRALDQLGGLPSNVTHRREQIKLQVALINALHHVKGYAAPASKVAVEQARSLIEEAEALGEAPDDPVLLFSVLYGVWAASWVAFNGDICRDLSTQFMALAGKQADIGPRMIAHRLMGLCLAVMGDLVQSKTHFDQAIDTYDFTKHRNFAMRFGTDARVSVLSMRSWTQWMLGYPEKALADAEEAVKNARDLGQAATLMHALAITSWTYLCRGDYETANRQADEVMALAQQKGTAFWKALAMLSQGSTFVSSGKVPQALEILTSGLTALRATGAALFVPCHLSSRARAYIELNRFEDASRCITEAMTAMEQTKDKFFEAEINRIAGEIVLKSPSPDIKKAEAYFHRALAVARKQEARAWELRAAMSIARLWHSQNKRSEAHTLVAEVYEWFSEGFDTLDLKDARVLLESL